MRVSGLLRWLSVPLLWLPVSTAGCDKKRELEPPPKVVASAAPVQHTDEGDETASAAAGGDAAAPSAEAGAPKGAVTTLDKKDLKTGTGPAAKAGDLVRVHYTGRLLDGTKFDSSLDRGDPFEFTLGQGQVIKGWDEGVAGMKKGGKRKLTIPSDMAYGKIGSPPKIPPDSPLEFDVELLEIKAK